MWPFLNCFTVSIFVLGLGDSRVLELEEAVDDVYQEAMAVLQGGEWV